MTKINENTGSFTVEKYLPHNFLAEKTILSSLLVSSEAIESCLRSLTVETFYFKNHQELYKAILAMYRRKLPIDIITVNSFLQAGLGNNSAWILVFQRTIPTYLSLLAIYVH